MELNVIPGGVCAAKGFKAAGVHCGVKSGSHGLPSANLKNDLAMILSDVPCAAAAMYTTNRVKAAPLYVTMDHLADGSCRGVIANSGNANACCPGSKENAEKMCALAAAATGLKASDFAVASTGVIGQTINIAAIEGGVPSLVASLNYDGSDAAAQAIMTTDTVKKERAVSFELDGKTVTVGAIAKGSGMIHPNMGTMLCFIATDCAISAAMLDKALHTVVPRTFNRVTVDGDTSTNDTCLVMANGLAENTPIEEDGAAYQLFLSALMDVCTYLARVMAADGEGASRLITCTVQGASDEASAEGLAKSVVGSSLVKAAMFGADANWGRVLCAMGYSGIAFDPEQVDVTFRSAQGEVAVCQAGQGLPFDEELAAAVLKADEVIIDITLREGDGAATCWGCDLTYEYVKINGDYRS